jgi:uncharacterized membrane protein (Fun14 family)
MLPKRRKNRTEKSAAPQKPLPKKGSPWIAKPVWLAAGLLIGAGSAMVSDPAKNPTISRFQNNAPTIVAMTAGFLSGFFIAWWARRAIIIISIVTAILFAVAGLFIVLGDNGSEIKAWINSVNVWMREYIDSAKYYLISVLPCATAVGVGGVLGFRRK